MASEYSVFTAGQLMYIVLQICLWLGLEHSTSCDNHSAALLVSKYTQLWLLGCLTNQNQISCDYIASSFYSATVLFSQ